MVPQPIEKHQKANLFQDVTVQEMLTFPQLKPLCIDMLNDILEDMIIESRDLDYAGGIRAYGGVENLTTTLLSYVRPEIRELEGQTITKEALMGIRDEHAQDRPWDHPLGYLDFITDSRDAHWLRLYVGQTNNARRRIISQHLQEVQKGSFESLHYFIIWLGNGTRSSNFIKLWESPVTSRELDENEKNWEIIKTNLLEALFCKAFSTHHGILDRFDTKGNCDYPKRPSYGLNLMTPLAQNGYKVDAKRSSIVAAAEETPDKQILYWVEVFRELRRSTLRDRNKKLITARRPSFRCDFDMALKTALGEELFETVKDSLVSKELYHAENNVDSESIPYFGSLSAKIGFVLDYGAISPMSGSFPEKIEQPIGIDPNEISLPWSLKGCQFNKENALLWTFNFKKFRPFGADVLSRADDLSRIYENNLRHQELINKSQAKIIFMCGHRAEKAVLPTSRKRYILELRGFQYHMYIGDHQRLFIHLPALPSRIWSNVGNDSSKVSLGIRFAVSMLGLQGSGIRPYSVETTCVVGTLVSWARQERLGKKPMEMKDVDTFIRLWLARKGLHSEILHTIMQLTGSVTTGMLMILHALPRHPTQQSSKKREFALEESDEQQLRGQKKRNPNPQLFDRNVFGKVKDLVKGAVEDRDRDYNEILQSLPPIPVAEQAEQADSEFLDMLTSTSSIRRSLFKRVRSGMAKRRQRETQSSGEQESDNELDIHILDAAPLYSEAIKEGCLRPEPPQVVERRTSQVWENRVDTYEHTEYPYQVKGPQNVDRQITVNSCGIFFKKGLDLGNGKIGVRIQISPPGEKHPHYYARKALDTDPAIRLAFLIRYQPSSGPEVQKFAKSNGPKQALFAANAFVDTLTGKSKQEIATIPRRYLFLHKQNAYGPGLERFYGGGYTDGS